MDRDRQAILARRARFIASTLALLSPAAPARAEPCPPAAPPSEEDLQTARALLTEGQSAASAGDLELARANLERAYALTGKPQLLAMLGRLALDADDPAGAVRHLDRYFECAEEPDESLKALRAQALSRTATLHIATEPSGATVELDGESIGTAPLEERVNPGHHTVRATWSDAKHLPYTRTLELGKGDTTEITLEGDVDDCRGDPCVCLQPLVCLEPPIEPEWTPTWGMELGYRALIDVANREDPHHGHGGHVAGFYAFPLGRPTELRLKLVAEPSTVDSRAWLPLGAGVEASLFGGPLRMGIGVVAGYGLSDPPPNTRLPDTGVYLAPEIVVAGRLGKRFEIGVRNGFVATELASGSFRVSHVSAGLWLGVLFGLRENPDYSEMARGSAPQRQ